jgi:HAE1 family hydrophobic/amphiphilic exporter-1
MAEAGYRAGVKTRLEVDDAEFNLQSARSNLAIAKRDTIAAQIQLLWIKGEDIQAALAKG